MRARAVEAHIDLVRSLSRLGGPLAPGAPTASVRNPAWFVGSEPLPARRRLHERFRREFAGEGAGAQRQAVVMAGPPGAGKTGVRQAFVREVLGAGDGDFVVVDADDFKRMLLGAALEDGSYEGWLKPARVRELEAGGERFFPLELSALVHEESSVLAGQFLRGALARGYNVVVDAVLSRAERARQLGAQLQAAGYSVSVVDVEVPFEVSQARIRARWQQDYLQALEGRGFLGGRWVPSEYAREVYGDLGGRSHPEMNAAALAREFTNVERFQRYRATSVDAAAVLEVDLLRAGPDAALVQASAPEPARDGGPSAGTAAPASAAAGPPQIDGSMGYGPAVGFADPGDLGEHDVL